MAPEQCDPVTLGPVGTPADVFGLGATLYRAASGARPFPRAEIDMRGPEARWPQLVAEPRAELLPRVIAEPVMACLARDPAVRPGPAALANALEPVLRAQPKPRLSGLRPRWR
jgi:serine/threonine protein kinase